MLNVDERLIDFSTARAKSGVPAKVGIGCWYRWALKGINGVRLEHIRIGRRLFTTMESVERFLAATNTPAESSSPMPQIEPRKQRRQSPKRRAADVEAAESRWSDLSGSAA